MPDHENPAGKKYPGGAFGFLARFRDSGALAALPAKQLKVIIALYSRRDKLGYAWPTYARLAHDAGVSCRTVKRAVQWAKACLGVSIERRSRMLRYRLPLDEPIDRYSSYSKKRKRVK